MNTRIQELAREAGLLVHNPDGVPTKLGKFAELLIRECAGIMYGRDKNGNCKDGDTILEHFGVEE